MVLERIGISVQTEILQNALGEMNIKIICQILYEQEIQIVRFIFYFMICIKSLFYFLSDWEGNPTGTPPADEIIWNDWVSTQNFFDLGVNATLEFGEQVIDKRQARCDMLDEIDHYMLH